MTAAQDVTVTPLDDADSAPTADALAPQTQAVSQEVDVADAGALRVLDKLTGQVTDLTLQQGETQSVGFLSVTLNACRYPVENPAGDAFALIAVVERREDTPLFTGWLLASSPALNAMDHPRYDVWALRCITS